MAQETEFQFEYSELTDVGCVREVNEDSLFSQSGLWLVADGMGGHACGDVASALAIDEVPTHFAEFNSLPQAIQSAHQIIKEAGEVEDELSGMGTTIVALSSDSVSYNIAWVGDSRAYLWDARVNKLLQLSVDHSLMVRLISAGLISAEDALTHPQRHMITQCLGSVQIEQVKVDMIEREWGYRQQIMLCSDGLTDEVTDEQIVAIMSIEKSSDEKVGELIEKAKLGGGRDNISVIIVDSPIKAPLSFMQNICQRFKEWLKRAL